MPNTKFYTSIILTSVLSLTSFSGCGTGDKDDVKKGGFELRLTDAPIDDVESVLVTFDEIAVRRCVTKEESKDAGKGDKDDEDAKDEKDEKDEKKERESDETTTGTEDETGSTSGDDTTQESTGGSQDDTSTDDTTADDTSTDDKDDDQPADKENEEAETESPDCVKEEWKVLSTKEMSFDLLKLRNGKTKRMVSMDLEAGTYNQVRLKLTKAQLVVDGEKLELDVPSGSKSGLKVKAVFVIDEKNNSSMTVDFDAGKSLTRTGKDEWKLQPVLKAFKPTKTKRDPETGKDVEEEEDKEDKDDKKTEDKDDKTDDKE